jgi:hypothetical protein
MTDQRQESIDFIASHAERTFPCINEDGSLRFTQYFGGLIGTAANLKTHYVRVTVYAGRIDIDSNCGTTTRWNASAHTTLKAKGEATVTCKRCNPNQ